MAPVGRPRRGSLIRHGNDKSTSFQQATSRTSNGNKNKTGNNPQSTNDHQKDLVNKVLDKSKAKAIAKAKLPLAKTKANAPIRKSNRIVEEKKEPEPEYDIYSDESNSDSSFSSGSYDSDISSSYYSSDGDYGRRNIFGSCCSNLFIFGKSVWEKFLRNWITAYGIGIRLVEFARSERVTEFLAKVVKLFWIIFLFVVSVSRDIRNFLTKAFKVISTEGFSLAKVTGKHAWMFIKFAGVELLALTGLFIIFAYEKSIELLSFMKKGSYNVAMFPYLLGKAIVNIPWILYDVFFENTEKLAPILYGVLGWSIVFFIYIPVLATILHAMDILTIEDLDTLGLKNLCIYLGLIREEHGFWHIVKKVGHSIFFR